MCKLSQGRYFASF